MPTVPSRRFSPEFKLKVMERIRCGEVLSAVAEELGVHRQLLYKWRDALRRNEGSFPRRGRPTRAEVLAKQAMAAEEDALEAANRKIAELERKSLPPRRRGLASKRWSLIFFSKPCGVSRNHARRPTRLA